MADIRAVLFDSGGVLIGPVGGRWNPRRDFEATVLAVAPHLSDDDFARAVAVGDEWLATAPAAAHRDDYHRAVLACLEVEPSTKLLADLMRPVDPSWIVEPFPEVVEVLDELRRRHLRLAVVSDASPELPALHAGVGLGDYFEAYAISAVLGCTKPDPRMFHHASDALGLEPSECLFLDDVPQLVEAAMRLGYQAAAVIRTGHSPADHLIPTISNLRQVLALL